MGNITISIPNELEATLDAYAAEHHLPVSRVVAQALRAFFEDAGPPPPATDLVATQRYLGQVVEQLEVFRESLHQMAIAQSGPFAAIPEALSRPLPPPPWATDAEASSI